MTSELEKLSEMEYPGRFIILGRSADDANNIAVYGITGRSSSSQARRLVSPTRGVIQVEPTNPEEVKKGNPDLLIYPAMMFSYTRLAVSNGKQTNEVFDCIGDDLNSVESSILRAHHNFTYEPDSPNFTPRISGIMHRDLSLAALGIIRKSKKSDAASKTTFALQLVRGKGYLISTYTGVNVNPLPSFEGWPLEVDLTALNPVECARIVYDSLAPKEGKDDFRVAVASIYSESRVSASANYPKHHIINSQDLKEKK